MYASNEHEFDREEKDWVFLAPASAIAREPLRVPTNCVVVDDEDDDDGASSISSSSSSSSSSSKNSTNLPSSFQNEPPVTNTLEHTATVESLEEQDGNSISTEVTSLVEDFPVVDAIVTTKIVEPDDLVPTGLPVDDELVQEITPVIEENDVDMKEPTAIDEPVSVSNEFREPRSADIEPAVSMISDLNVHELIAREQSRTVHVDRSSMYGLAILILVASLMFANSTYRYKVGQMKEQLVHMNERLHALQRSSVDQMEQQIMKQVYLYEERIENSINERMAKYDGGRESAFLELSRLDEKWNQAQGDVAKQIDQLRQENDRLEEKIRNLEIRLQQVEKTSKTKGRPKGNKKKKPSKSPLDTLLTSTIKQTVAVAKDASSNLSSLFEHWSSSVGELFDQRQELIEQSKKKLTKLAQSPTVNKVQSTLRKGVAGLSASFEKAKASYATWTRTRAEQRQHARTQVNNDEQTTVRHPWRWTFQRGQNREQLRRQPQIIKKQPVNIGSACHSLYNYPIDSCCVLKRQTGKYY